MRILLCILFCPIFCYSQNFFVEPTEKGFEKEIISKMKYEGYHLVEARDSSDITLKCLVEGRYNAWKVGSMFHGYVKFVDSKTDEELIRTKVVGKSPAAVNGFQAGPRIMQVIAEKYLEVSLKAAVEKRKQKYDSQ